MSKKHKGPPIVGPLIFNVKKPVGQTSFSIVSHFKRNLPLGYGKIGHFGTLDPFAEGVLMIGIAGASRLNDYVHKYMPKTYIAKGILGKATPTGDFEVEADQIRLDDNVDEKINKLSKEDLQKIFDDNFIGDYLQTPPSFSAVKHQGKPLYKWAREGVEIKKDAVKRFIYSIEVISFSGREVVFKAKVGSGTYIRTLFTDFAKKINTLGALLELSRTSVGHISIEDSLSKDNWPIEGKTVTGDVFGLEENGLKLDQVLPARAYVLNEEDSTFYRNGVNVVYNSKIIVDDGKPPIIAPEGELLWVYDFNEELIGLGLVKNNKIGTCFNLPQRDNV